MSDQLLWEYNLRDCLNTRIVREKLQSLVDREEMQQQAAFEHSLFRPVLKAMLRGVKVDQTRRSEVTKALNLAIQKEEKEIKEILGHEINFSSPAQMMTLFYGDFGLSPQRNKKTGNLSADDLSLQKATKNEPILRYLVNRISRLRSYYVFYRTFATGLIDPDGRIRCTFNPAGAITFRFTASKSVWKTGFNFQNVPKGGENGLPNIREFFIADDDMIFFDGDLSRADMYIVAAEAQEQLMLEALQKRVDLHIMNGFVISGRDLPPLEELVEGGHERYPHHRSKLGKWRQFAKTWAHGVNYGGSDRTMAQSAGITVRESEEARKNYFGHFPGLKKWHEATYDKLLQNEPIINSYGYSTRFFGDPGRDLSEALAWVPQSTVGLHINRIWIQLDRLFASRGLEVLIQVHDSIAGQFPLRDESLLSEMEVEANKLLVPYGSLSGTTGEGLLIPWTPKTGKNWGEACA